LHPRVVALRTEVKPVNQYVPVLTVGAPSDSLVRRGRLGSWFFCFFLRLLACVGLFLVALGFFCSGLWLLPKGDRHYFGFLVLDLEIQTYRLQDRIRCALQFRVNLDKPPARAGDLGWRRLQRRAPR